MIDSQGTKVVAAFQADSQHPREACDFQSHVVASLVQIQPVVDSNKKRPLWASGQSRSDSHSDCLLPPLTVPLQGNLSVGEISLCCISITLTLFFPFSVGSLIIGDVD